MTDTKRKARQLELPVLVEVKVEPLRSSSRAPAPEQQAMRVAAAAPRTREATMADRAIYEAISAAYHRSTRG